MTCNFDIQYCKCLTIFEILLSCDCRCSCFNKRPHDSDLALEICQGLRPDIIEGIIPEYAELMKKCWDSNPNKRPTAKELIKYFKEWKNEYPFEYNANNEFL